MVLVIGVPVVGRFIRERPRDLHRERGAHATEDGVRFKDAIASRPFWIVVTVLFFGSLAQNGALTHMAALLTDRGVSPAGASLALGAMGGAGLFGRLVTGWLLDRFFAPRVSMCLLGVAAAGVLWLASASSAFAGVGAATLIGLGMGAEADVTPYLLSQYFGLRSFSTLYGLTWTAYAVAGAIGPVLMGRAYDLTGSYRTLLQVLAGGTVLVASLMMAMPRYERAIEQQVA
jgi:predicted MFS family arabinose efflux permease